MVRLVISDVVDNHITNDDGDKLYQEIVRNFSKDNHVTVSFAGISGVNSSFVNSAFIQLLESYNFKFIKQNLHFSETNKQINEIINNRFKFETRKMKKIQYNNL